MPVSVHTWLRRTRLRLPVIQALTQRILVETGHPRALVSLDFIGDRRMRRLNQFYRGRDGPTDVLAFAVHDAPGPRTDLLGDVVISMDTAARQAERHGHDLSREVVILLIHGVLHLLGFDHERSHTEARRMARRERMILRKLMPVPVLIQGR